MTAKPHAQPKGFNVDTIKADFPIFTRETRGKRLTYLDSAASSQKPHAVIETLDTFYRVSNANIHRGVYELSEEATAAYDLARRKIARFTR